MCESSEEEQSKTQAVFIHPVCTDNEIHGFKFDDRRSKQTDRLFLPTHINEGS